MIKKFKRPARREIMAAASLLAVLSIALLTEQGEFVPIAKPNET